MPTNVNTRTATITFPTDIRLTPRKGAEFVGSLADVPESIIGDLLVTGVRIKATNAYNSGGAETPEADRIANVERLFAAWARGELNAGSSGPRDSMVGDMREAYVTKQVALGRSVKDAESAIKSTVESAFGKDHKATFPAFLDAVATLKTRDIKDESKRAKAYADLRAELEKSATDAAMKLRAERAEATESLDINTADLF